jgi:hypothetical protein
MTAEGQPPPAEPPTPEGQNGPDRGEAEPVSQQDRLAAAVAELDQRSRLLLYLSVRHRIPDEKLADFLQTDAAAIARDRAHVIERITDELGMKSVGELAEVLEALPALPPESWGVPSTPDLAQETPAAADEADGRVSAGDWLRSLPRRRIALAGVPIAAIGSAIGVLVASGEDTEAGRSSRDAKADRGSRDGAPFVPLGGRPPAGSDSGAPATSFPIARLEKATVLRSRPGGRRLRRVSPRTEFGSARILSVVRRRKRWLGVLAPELANGKIGWIPSRKAAVDRVRYSLHTDLSRRQLSVLKDGRLLRRLTVTIGAADTPTPAGRFAVTDKLRVENPSSPYGCCVLALTGHQPNVPDDWPGGDRLAIHATRDASTLGDAVSLGCMRAKPAQMRWLVKTIPLGTPVFVRYGPPPSEGLSEESAPFPAR